MLVLSRKENESIYIGEDIRITVVRILGDKVRLGLEAPDDVIIARKEIFQGFRRRKTSKGELTHGQKNKTNE